MSRRPYNEIMLGMAGIFPIEEEPELNTFQDLSTKADELDLPLTSFVMDCMAQGNNLAVCINQLVDAFEAMFIEKGELK